MRVRVVRAVLLFGKMGGGLYIILQDKFQLSWIQLAALLAISLPLPTACRLRYSGYTLG
jgi:hypothetical protein